VAFSSDHLTGLFLDHSVSNHYVFLPGNAPLPIAYQTGPAQDSKSFEVVKTERPGWFRIYEFSFTRARYEPPIPPITPGPDEDLYHATISLASHTETESGMKMYTTTGAYVYSLKYPLDPNSSTGLNAPVRPAGYLYSG
jgi:hypothetical protein